MCQLTKLIGFSHPDYFDTGHTARCPVCCGALRPRYDGRGFTCSCTEAQDQDEAIAADFTADELTAILAEYESLDDMTEREPFAARVATGAMFARAA